MLEGYEKLKVVGKGSFGTATLYKRLVDNQYVVVKEILTIDMDDEEKRSAYNEVEVISTLSHQNIIRYIESFEMGGSIIIIMEYADGGNLSQLINLKKHKGDSFTEKGILDIMSQISAALSYMHSKKILHRDLKAANVFISMRGIIKLGDFGISKMLNTKSQANTVVGTPYYLSPEMCNGYEYNEKSDIWAMGCILYELTTLKKPFIAQNLPALVHKITTCQYESIPQFYSDDLSSLIRDLLQKSPENRPHAKEIHDVFIPKIQEGVVENDTSTASSTSDQSVSDVRSILYEIQNFCDEKMITPIELPHKKIISVSVSPTHTLVLTADHMVYAWGENNFGQLAIESSDSYKKYPVCAGYLRNKNILKCCAGVNFSLFLNSQGLIYTCGDTSKGCLGHEEHTNATHPKICNILVMSTITDICCGKYHSVALSTEGRVFTWGQSKFGELGLGSIEQRNKPTTVRLPTKINRIFCSEDATLLLASNEKILVAGRNNYNKLGVYKEGNIRTFHTINQNYGQIRNVSMSVDRTVLVNEQGQLVIMGKDGEYGGDTGPRVVKLSSKISMSACTSKFISVADQQNVIWFWGSYRKRIGGESTGNTYTERTRNNKYQSVVSLQTENYSNTERLPSSNFETVCVKTPKSILALFSSEENIRNGYTIHIGDIKAKENSILVLVHTTTPLHSKNFSSSCAENSSFTQTSQENEHSLQKNTSK